MADRANANHFPLVTPEKSTKKKAEATEAPASEDN
jgi:hypothetical protein